MVLQTLCAALYHNTHGVISWFEQTQCTELFLTDLIKFVPDFTMDYQVRRVIFGLARLIAADGLPQSAFAKLPELFRCFRDLVLK